MNTFIYMKSKNMIETQKLRYKHSKLHLVYALLVSMFLSISSSTVFATQTAEDVNVTTKTMNVLMLTETAIEKLESDPQAALNHVVSALNMIHLIESSFSHNTLTELSSEKSAGTSASHTHYFPRLDVDEISNSSDLPTLSNKIKSDILYDGNNASGEAWFDYTFAKASLVTVREAINADHSEEAMRNLKRVFEAIYIAPEFNVSEKLS